MFKDSTASLFDSFAALLEYPSSDFSEHAQECLELMRSLHPEAADMVEKFANAVEKNSLQRMQELFTTTFDMQPVCYPYVGFHLYGESYKRGAFMAQLNEGYHGIGYSAGQELPDNLSVILRFIGFDSENRYSEFSQALLSDGVLPSLEKMLKVFGEGSENPYFAILSALQLFVLTTLEKELTHD
ncbi:MAG TPA: molecular chaperone TorD family protein [Anaerolineales bacterium]|jgi:nitrate reductase delta subunit|nr:molecular chaperone TorD family protein [Anaerolineales bacterium]HQX15859.1 molecular chaperone TorD family protein [Anaerolineales bacterium]